MKQYLDLMKDILENGYDTGDRTGTGTRSVFGRQLRFDLTQGFPLLTTKKMFMKGVVHELLWFLSGSTNIKYLVDNGVHIWDAWADENGELGPVYGKQWRAWETKETKYIPHPSGIVLGGERYVPVVVDQIANVVARIKSNPTCRRLIVSAWNPAEIDKMKLPPCHALFQFKVYGDKLSCQLYQRSADYFLGVPFNIASYALLTHMVAQVTGLKAHEFIHTFGDAHIYSNHIDQCREQLTRVPHPSPRLNLNPEVKDIFGFKYEDVQLHDYEYWPPIRGEVSV